MYKIGDVVMHSLSGICRITGSENISVLNNPKKEYFVLKPLYEENNTVYVPADKIEDIVRKPLSKEQIESLFRECASSASLWIDDMKKRKDNFNQIIQKADPKELIVLIRSIYEKNAERESIGKSVSDADKRQMQRAETLLNGEVAYGLGIDINEIGDYIKKILEN